ncbi:hypothetical protein [Afifella sp. IM 167]|uniref:hypothetical protein n=1 Tax=Afifella sp. IM 167 TaxID=2033586 RepID=UPI001CCC1312|nr:hypothetical protein [Afifella sp. IM 167]MBZ8132636.1 hypothetical protein [Afifella sp. IM 167]
MRLIFPLFLGALLLAGCATHSSSTHGAWGDWYAARGARAPKGEKVYVCHAFGCLRTSPVTFSPAELKRISAPFRRAGSPQAERQAISKADQIYEEIVGARIGTSADRGGFEKIGGGDPTQMDCIDEATNTTSLLILLAERGILKHHSVESPVARGFFLDGRYPHATAVVAEVESGRRFAIDSWPIANAEPPVIMPLEKWLSARGGS